MLYYIKYVSVHIQVFFYFCFNVEIFSKILCFENFLLFKLQFFEIIKTNIRTNMKLLHQTKSLENLQQDGAYRISPSQ